MATISKTPRKRGRPFKEETNAIAMEQAMLHARSKFAELVVPAMETLKSLLTDGSDKVKEGVAKYIITEAEKAHKEDLSRYEADQKEDEVEGPNLVDSATVASTSSIPLTTEIREYQMVENDD